MGALSHRAVGGLYTCMLIFVYDKHRFNLNRRTCSRIHHHPEKESIIKTLLVCIRQQRILPLRREELPRLLK